MIVSNKIRNDLEMVKRRKKSKLELATSIASLLEFEDMGRHHNAPPDRLVSCVVKAIEYVLLINYNEFEKDEELLEYIKYETRKELAKKPLMSDIKSIPELVKEEQEEQQVKEFSKEQEVQEVQEEQVNDKKDGKEEEGQNFSISSIDLSIDFSQQYTQDQLSSLSFEELEKYIRTTLMDRMDGRRARNHSAKGSIIDVKKNEFGATISICPVCNKQGYRVVFTPNKEKKRKHYWIAEGVHHEYAYQIPVTHKVRGINDEQEIKSLLEKFNQSDIHIRNTYFYTKSQKNLLWKTIENKKIDYEVAKEIIYGIKTRRERKYEHNKKRQFLSP